LEEILREAERRGWRVKKPSKYFKMYCPCAEKHFKTVHLTPSGANYAKNLKKWLERQSCWEGDD
jgi:hypothetical protein